MKNLERKTVRKIMILIVIIILILLKGTEVQANVQSRPNAKSMVNQTASSFFALIRQMELSGQAMALNATIDGTGKETSGSNNIDVHMIKNTEYGGVAMLSASSYGSCPTGTQSGEADTTTGNKYGIYQISNGYEYVAGMLESANSSYVTNIKNASKRYWNYYTNPSNTTGDYSGFVPGDATKETAYWKGMNSASFVNTSDPVFLRSVGVFGFNNVSGFAYSFYGSRVAVVCGAGL